MTAQPKIQKLLALTESSNDHEALNALRRVQQILSQSRSTLANYVHSNQSSSDSHDSLRSELRMAKANATHWKNVCERLSEENAILRLFKPTPPKRKSSARSKSAKAKLEKLKTKISDLEEDIEIFEETILDLEKEIEELRKKKFSSARGDPESIIQSFIDDYCIYESKNSWFGTKELHQIFKKSHPKSEMSLSLFSRVFSKLTECRPSKGGPRKQIMGFCVSLEL